MVLRVGTISERMEECPVIGTSEHIIEDRFLFDDFSVVRKYDMKHWLSESFSVKTSLKVTIKSQYGNGKLYRIDVDLGENSSEEYKDEKGWHGWIKAYEDEREYHGYSDLTETGFYEQFIRKRGYGLIYYTRDFGAERDMVELVLNDNY